MDVGGGGVGGSKSQYFPIPSFPSLPSAQSSTFPMIFAVNLSKY